MIYKHIFNEGYIFLKFHLYHGRCVRNVPCFISENNMFFYILNENTYISALKNKNHIVVLIHRNTIPRGSAQNFQWISHVRKRKALKCNLVVSHTYKNYFVLMIVFRETIIVGCWIQCIDFLKYWMYYYGLMSHIWTGM